MELVLYLLMIQALMGAFDTLYHHEFTEALPQHPTARKELSIHALRAILYGLVFLGIAWFEWGGIWVFVLIALVLVEVVLTLWDFVVEDQTRLLPASERVTHTLLAVNGGAAFGLLALQLPQWYSQPSGLYLVDYGWISWFLSLSAAGVMLSGLRDAWAAWWVQRLDLRLKLDLGEHQRLLISGGTGFIGSALVRELLYCGHDITLLSRKPLKTAMQFGARVRAVRSLDELSSQEYFHTVINLAGAPVVGFPWTIARRRTIAQSRYNTTAALLRFAKRAHQRPAQWIQASAVGFYGTDSHKTVDETAGVGEGFAAELCLNWETMVRDLKQLNIRCVILRFGLVFGRSGGALPMMLLPYRFGLGAVLGTGQQHLAWIHIEDLLRVMALCIKDSQIDGSINAVAPDCPDYRQFSASLGKVLHRPVWMRIPAGLLRVLLGEMADMFIKGPSIKASRLGEMAFEYRFVDLRSALMDLS